MTMSIISFSCWPSLPSLAEYPYPYDIGSIFSSGPPSHVPSLQTTMIVLVILSFLIVTPAMLSSHSFILASLPNQGSQMPESFCFLFSFLAVGLRHRWVSLLLGRVAFWF